MAIKYIPEHTAISVSDLDKSVEWYNKMLGFKETQRFDIPQMNARAAFMSLDDLYNIELFEIKDSKTLPEYRRNLISDLQTVGTKHMAFRVEDINAAYRDLQEKGAEFLFEPRMGASGNYYTFLKDPDGILLEIIAKR